MTPSARPAGGSDPSPPAAGRTGEIAGTADGINAGPTIPPPRTEPAGEHGTGGMDGVAAPPRAVEPAGGEPAGGEPAGGEPAGGEPPRVEPPRVEPPRVEPPRVEPPRVEPPRVEPPRVEPPRVDGRTARSERTRGAIVDAHLELIREGDLRPTADRIAKQAGVSLRALWSHFADMEALFTASGRRVLELRAANHRPVSPDLPLAERIAAYSDQQARLLEEITPTARAAALKEPFSDVLRHYRRLHVTRTRDELVALFADDLGGDDERLNALVAVSMWPTWSTWRETMELAPETARDALARTITALLAG